MFISNESRDRIEDTIYYARRLGHAVVGHVLRKQVYRPPNFEDEKCIRNVSPVRSYTAASIRIGWRIVRESMYEIIRRDISHLFLHTNAHIIYIYIYEFR